jgi:hypothetical protein
MEASENFSLSFQKKALLCPFIGEGAQKEVCPLNLMPDTISYGPTIHSYRDTVPFILSQ